jgi:hypothetical protein
MTRKFAILATLLVLAGCAKPASPPPAPVVPIPPPPKGEPDLFTGLPAARLRVQLGSPAFIRKDGATEMWRYDGKDCHAYFFLYGAGAAQVVRHVETLPQGKNAAADPACLNGLKKIP